MMTPAHNIQMEHSSAQVTWSSWQLLFVDDDDAEDDVDCRAVLSFITEGEELGNRYAIGRKTPRQIAPPPPPPLDTSNAERVLDQQ
mmetsp:Transcript_33852/g.71193  ORF Transcript_33852/g.71193 Transcript_33852/m.71193 type:complete len:86 (+) Transcript_33852:209-466(+)